MNKVNSDMEIDDDNADQEMDIDNVMTDSNWINLVLAGFLET